MIAEAGRYEEEEKKKRYEEEKKKKDMQMQMQHIAVQNVNLYFCLVIILLTAISQSLLTKPALICFCFAFFDRYFNLYVLYAYSK